jgi:hypothetical protein
MTKEQAQQVLDEFVHPIYLQSRNVSAQMASDVQAARRVLEGTVKSDGAPLEATGKARLQQVAEPNLVSDNDMVVMVDPRGTLPDSAAAVKRLLPLPPNRLQPEALPMNPEIKFAMDAIVEGRVNAEHLNRLNFAVDWTSPSQPHAILEQMGYAFPDRIRIMSSMDRLIGRGWSQMPHVGRGVMSEPLDNTATERVEATVTRPERVAATTGPEQASIGNVASRPDPYSIDVVVESQAIEPPLADPLRTGFRAQVQSERSKWLGEFKQLQSSLADAIEANDRGGNVPGSTVRDIQTALKDVRGKITRAEEYLSRVGEISSAEEAGQPLQAIADRGQLFDVVLSHIRELSPDRALQYIKTNPGMFKGPDGPRLREHAMQVVEEARAVEVADTVEMTKWSAASPAVKRLHRGKLKRKASKGRRRRRDEEMTAEEEMAERVSLEGKAEAERFEPTAEEEAVARQFGFDPAGMQIEVGKLETAPAQPPRPPKGESFAELKRETNTLGVKFEQTPEGKWVLDTLEFNKLKDVRVALDAFNALRVGSEGPGAASKKEFERPPKGSAFVHVDKLNPGMINKAAHERGAEIAHVDDGWLLWNHREGTHQFFPERAELPMNGYLEAVETLQQLPVRKGPDFGVEEVIRLGGEKAEEARQV